MLPGFRFLFTAIVLSMSVLIFGLGAAALLRAAHEEFANLPARRTAPAPMFARRTDDAPPTLALLRIETPTEEKPAENMPAAVPDAAADTPAAAGPALEPAPARPEQLAALAPAEPAQAEAAKPDVAKDAIADSPAVPVPPAEAAAPAEKPDARVAAIAEAPEPAVAAPPAPDVYSFESNPAATRIATLGGPAVIVDEKAAFEALLKPEAKAAEARPDRNAIRKQAAERAREKRRIAAARRARLAREAVLTLQQQQPNPFIQTPFAQGPISPTTR